LRAAAGSAPEGRLLVETDSPFLTPQSHRGSPNRPANVVSVVEAVADVRQTDAASMTARTTANALDAFPFLR
ncbi:MAG TPA: TatD family hydrolase, partial [Actinomycetota bacterium]|nr:TatD family hydrolase [Actinomycetota bacterium]